MLGIATGGFAANGFLTENGLQPVLGTQFSLKEAGGTGSYAVRTRLNVDLCDATVVVAKYPDSPGTKLTRWLCEEGGKPHLVVDPFCGRISLAGMVGMDAAEFQGVSDQVREFLDEHRPAILNVAGNRETKAPGIQNQTRLIMLSALYGEKG